LRRSNKFGDSFLEKPPTTNDLNQDSIFGKADYARAFLWNAYTKLYYGLPYYWGGYDEKKMNTGMLKFFLIAGIVITVGME
jgi:hypothetical protein